MHIVALTYTYLVCKKVIPELKHVKPKMRLHLENKCGRVSSPKVKKLDPDYFISYFTTVGLFFVDVENFVTVKFEFTIYDDLPSPQPKLSDSRLTVHHFMY